ncbi:MAG: hypothetical protein JOZ08_03810 [Verrucomicrobia bacterium]|nr:hypothetical protein [Verrucomicrobiota bacterium]
MPCRHDPNFSEIWSQTEGFIRGKIGQGSSLRRLINFAPIQSVISFGDVAERESKLRVFFGSLLKQPDRTYESFSLVSRFKLGVKRINIDPLLCLKIKVISFYVFGRLFADLAAFLR